jgi:hypothetical protein
MAVSNENSSGLSNKIDDYIFENRSSENMMYMLIAVVIGFLVYQFIFLETDKSLKLTQNKHKSMKTKVMQNQSYLSINSEANLQSIKDSIVAKNRELDDANYKISYVDNTLTELSYLLFDNQSWANFVDNISEIAKKYKVDIREISNRFYKPTFQKISHVVEIDVESKASFSNTIKFLNEIEESKLVIDVSELNITKPDDKLMSRIKIAVWGMKY